MDRIKQALDKARAERNAAEGILPATGNGADHTLARAEKKVLDPQIESSIQYSRTKVHALDIALLRGNRVVLEDSDRSSLAAYKMLRTQVLQRMTARGWNALAVTSPVPGDGKTLTSINLAISLARELHHTVLLVDMDLRNPNVHRYFGLEPSIGISDFLLGAAEIGDVMINPGIERLVVLPGRVAVENSSEILASPAMGHLVQELKSRYPSRMVLFDLPPVLSADDALSFAPFVDAFLLVVRDGKSTNAEIERAMEILRDIPVIGTVLNGSDEKASDYY